MILNTFLSKILEREVLGLIELSKKENLAPLEMANVIKSLLLEKGNIRGANKIEKIKEKLIYN